MYPVPLYYLPSAYVYTFRYLIRPLQVRLLELVEASSVTGANPQVNLGEKTRGETLSAWALLYAIPAATVL